MDDEGVEGSGVLKKNKLGAGEVDFKEKSGTAWSHSFLNQKPWHPLSYPNQRRKWIAEQTDAQHQRRAEEVAREFAQEQEFFRQSALISKKEKEKVEIMKAVSFMYVRPPGYNAESAKAAELEDERRKSEGSCPPQLSTDSATIPSSIPPEEKKKSRPKDVYGRTLPTEEEFEVLKNAPRLETGLPARAKPFGIEVRNVKCLRCGNYGHQSGDRECSLRDAIMPNEENRLKRDDPLTSIMAHTDTSEPLKWELKQKPGISPPRGGFKPDDPNQQIVAEDIFDEYGGFLSGGIIPDLLTNFSVKKSKKHSKSKSKYKGESSTTHDDPKVHKTGLSPSYSDSDREKSSKKRKMKKKQKKEQHTDSLDKSIYRKHHHRSEHRQPVSSSSDDSEADIRNKRSKPLRSVSPDDSDHGRHQKRKKNRHTVSLDDSDHRRHKKRSKPQRSISPDDSKHDKHSQRNRIRRSVSPHDRDRHKKRSKPQHSVSPDDCRHRSVSPHDRDRHKKRSKPQHSVSPDDCRHHDRNKHRRSVSPGDSGHYRHNIRSKPQPSVSPDDRRHHSKHKHRRSVSLDGSDNDRHNKKSRHRRSISSDSAENDKDHKWNRYRGSISPDDSYYDRHHKRNNHR